MPAKMVSTCHYHQYCLLSYLCYLSFLFLLVTTWAVCTHCCLLLSHSETYDVQILLTWTYITSTRLVTNTEEVAYTKSWNIKNTTFPLIRAWQIVYLPLKFYSIPDLFQTIYTYKLHHSSETCSWSSIHHVLYLFIRINFWDSILFFLRQQMFLTFSSTNTLF